MEAYRRELEAKQPDELNALYAAEAEAEAQAAEQEERRRFFNLPSADADFAYWCKAAYWTLDEAVALSLGKDPGIVTPKSITHHRGFSPFVRSFDRLRALADRAKWKGTLFDPVLPSIFANWAVETDIPLPEDIIERVLNGKPAKVVLEGLVQQQSDLIALLEQNLDLKEQRLSLMAERLAVYEAATNEDAEAADASPSKPQSTVERDNMLKVIWSIAAENYGHRPDLKRSTAVADIRRALNLQGLDLSDDTIRRYLTNAEERLPDWLENKR
jgi:hypothetical protein